MHPTNRRGDERSLLGLRVSAGRSLWVIEDEDFSEAVERFASYLAQRNPSSPDLRWKCGGLSYQANQRTGLRSTEE